VASETASLIPATEEACSSLSTEEAHAFFDSAAEGLLDAVLEAATNHSDAKSVGAFVDRALERASSLDERLSNVFWFA